MISKAEPIGGGGSEGSLPMRVRSPSVALLRLACLALATDGLAWPRAERVQSEPFDQPVRFEEGGDPRQVLKMP